MAVSATALGLALAGRIHQSRADAVRRPPPRGVRSWPGSIRSVWMVLAIFRLWHRRTRRTPVSHARPLDRRGHRPGDDDTDCGSGPQRVAHGCLVPDIGGDGERPGNRAGGGRDSPFWMLTRPPSSAGWGVCMPSPISHRDRGRRKNRASASGRCGCFDGAG